MHLRLGLAIRIQAFVGATSSQPQHSWSAPFPVFMPWGISSDFWFYVVQQPSTCMLRRFPVSDNGRFRRCNRPALVGLVLGGQLLSSFPCFSWKTQGKPLKTTKTSSHWRRFNRGLPNTKPQCFRLHAAILPCGSLYIFNQNQQVLNPTVLNPTPPAFHKRKQQLRCNSSHVWVLLTQF